MIAGARGSTMGRRLALVPFAVLAVTAIVAIVVPVYTDEVAWRFQLSRYLQDGGLDRNNGESCGPNTSMAPPWTMLPVRLFSSLASYALRDPIYVRLAGVLCCLAALAMLLVAARRLAATVGRPGDPVIVAVPFALLGFGVLPFLLVWSRPEQPILLCLLATLLIGLRAKSRLARSGWPIAAVVVLAGVADSYHLKAIFYLPLFAWAILVAPGGRHRWLKRGAGLAAIAILAAFAYAYWTARFACPDDPVLVAKIADENAGSTLIHASMAQRIAALPSLLPNLDPSRYIALVFPAPHYMSEWLPPTRLPDGARLAWVNAIVIGWVAILLLGLAALVAIVTTVRSRATRWDLVALGLICLGCPSAWALLQSDANVYEAALYLPMLVVGVIALIAAADLRGIARRLAVALTAIVALSSIASQSVLIADYGGRLWSADHRGGYVPGQSYSLSPFGFAALRPRILAAGRLCGIPDRPAPARLLIDDLTYFAYADGYRPMHRLGVLSTWSGSITDPLKWMHDHRSSGAVIGCAYLPPAMRARAKAFGDFCCVAAP